MNLQTFKVIVGFTADTMSEKDAVAVIPPLLADGLIHNDKIAEEGTTIERVEQAY